MTLIVTTLTVCVSTAALGLASGIAVATGLLFAGIGSVAVFNIVGRSIRQAVTPNELLGRVVASFRMVGMAGGPVGAALGGLFASLTSVRATFLASGAIGLIATLQMVAATRGLDDSAGRG